MTILVGISKHAPEACPMFNEKNRKIMLDIAQNMEKLAKKHGVKLIGSWIVPSEHLNVIVCDAPSMEAAGKFGMEPVMLADSAYNSTEWKVASPFEELAEMLKKAK